jgi:hypothetical protein
MSAEQSKETTFENVTKIKQKIQGIVSKLMSNPEPALTEDENRIIEQIGKYKVATNLETLSKAFGDVVVTHPQTDAGS